MVKAILLTEEEWNELPSILGKTLFTLSQKACGFKIIDKSSGEEINDRLEDYLIGLMWYAITRGIKEDK